MKLIRFHIAKPFGGLDFEYLNRGKFFRAAGGFRATRFPHSNIDQTSQFVDKNFNASDHFLSYRKATKTIDRLICGHRAKR